MIVRRAAPRTEIALVEVIATISDEFGAYRWRWMQAALRQRIATTDSGHDGQIFPDLAKDVVLAGAGPALDDEPELNRHLERLC